MLVATTETYSAVGKGGLGDNFPLNTLPTKIFMSLKITTYK